MLNVQKYLKSACADNSITKLTSQQALISLKERTGVKYSIWNEQLVVLNYDQINSKKTCAIAQECRSLVLELGTWEIVSRSFDRFFNYGEEPCPKIDITRMVAYEKVDGSLIGLFNYKGEWLYRTRSVIMPENNINAWGVTWKEHIESALGENYKTRLSGLEEMTFILEMTSMENRVVTRYANQEPMMTLLATRVNDSGYYSQVCPKYCLAGIPEWRDPRTYTFETMEECLTAAKELRNLEEGFVLYNRRGVPVCKVKNPAYVAAHHLRGNGLNPKRIVDLVVMGEVDEYLALFPEDRKVILPYEEAQFKLIFEMGKYLSLCRDESLTQKEFALSIKDLPFKGILFNIRKGVDEHEAWMNCTTNTKFDLITSMMK